MNGGRRGGYGPFGADEEEDKGLVWKLPEIRSKQLGKVGPAFGIGVGCGFGLALGLIGGMGFGGGIPGLQLGLGVGAGCGIGVGFGYGVGRGIAYDHNRRYSNIGSFKFPSSTTRFPSQDEIGGLIDELVLNTKKLVDATSREVDKWRRH